MATGSDRLGYETELTPAAQRQLAKITKADRQASTKIVEAILGLADDLRHHGVEKLAGQGDRYRVRSGDYRAIFSIDDEKRVVTVETIGNRKDVYRGQ